MLWKKKASKGIQNPGIGGLGVLFLIGLSGTVR